MEEHAFTSMEGYDMELALPAAFKAMVRRYRESRRTV
jgi:hypothetical protein